MDGLVAVGGAGAQVGTARAEEAGDLGWVRGGVRVGIGVRVRVGVRGRGRGRDRGGVGVRVGFGVGVRVMG